MGQSLQRMASALCVGCLSLVTLSSAAAAKASGSAAAAIMGAVPAVTTVCCKRSICLACLDASQRCPVCKATLDKSPFLGLLPPPPSYFSSLGDQETSDLNSPASTAPSPPPQVSTTPSPQPAGDSNDNSLAGVPQSFEEDFGEVIIGDDGSMYVRHYVKARDTLVGLSLKYKVAVDAIKHANKLFNGNLHEREKILIPNVQYLPKTVNDPTDAHKLEREHQRASKRFQMVTKCTDLAEISFYMEENNFDLDKALKQYNEDIEWERAHPSPLDLASKSKKITPRQYAQAKAMQAHLSIRSFKSFAAPAPVVHDLPLTTFSSSNYPSDTKVAPEAVASSSSSRQQPSNTLFAPSAPPVLQQPFYSMQQEQTAFYAPSQTPAYLQPTYQQAGYQPMFPQSVDTTN